MPAKTEAKVREQGEADEALGNSVAVPGGMDIVSQRECFVSI
jgi:hypothetical protein